MDINTDGAYEGDYESLSYGSPDPDSFDNCIYIIDPNQVDINGYSDNQTCGGDWYVCYGDGCYGDEFAEGGEYPDGTPDWTGNIADVCKNPDHFTDGVHVGCHGDGEEPTEAPTEEPTKEPTEGPTEAPSEEPTEAPTDASAEEPTDAPTAAPTEAPTAEPTEKPVLLGDVNGNDEVEILDVTYIQCFLANIPVTDSFVTMAADADRDGEISILDGTAIQRWLAALPTCDGIGKPI